MSDRLGAGRGGGGGVGLTAAAWPRGGASGGARLIHADPTTGSLEETHTEDLPRLLSAGDLVVVNDAATLPASLRAVSRLGPVEIRLAGPPERAPEAGALLVPAVLFGPGTWRQRTEDRPPPPRLRPGDTLAFDESFAARIVQVSRVSPRLVELRFDRVGSAWWETVYRLGRPVQYSHLAGPLDLWHVNTAFAARPWAVEAPSAGLALTPSLLRALRRRGIRLVAVTHAAGLSATGDPVLDARLPFPERSHIPEETVEAVQATRSAGRRVVAIGTTVVRALEGRASEPEGLRAGEGLTTLRLGPTHVPRVVHGLLSGLHERGESHFELLRAFAPSSVLDAVLDRARREGYRGHEFGDACLILRKDP